MLSLIYSNKGDMDSIRSMKFKKKNNDVELIIIDSLWNKKTKKKLVDLTDYFKMVTYAPPKERKQERRYDLLSCHNTGLAYAEEEWCMTSGGLLEMKKDFFDKLRESIYNFGCGASMKSLDEKSWMVDGLMLRQEYADQLKQLDEVFGYGVAIRPVELEENIKDIKWKHGSRFVQRYVFLPSVPIGKSIDERAVVPIQTCGFIIMPRKTWYLINGFDEQYDVGCYWWDNELFDRMIINHIHIILDQHLMIFRHKHTTAFLPENPECKKIFIENQPKFHKTASNDFNLAELHERFIEKKQEYIL